MPQQNFHEVHIPKEEQACALAHLVAQRWNEAVRFRSAPNIDGTSLASEISACEKQFYATNKKEYTTYTGKNIYVNFAQSKTRVIKAAIAELMFPSGEAPFTVEPTPIPELQESDLESIAEEMFAMLIDLPGALTGGIEDLPGLITRMQDPDTREQAKKEFGVVDATLDDLAVFVKRRFTHRRIRAAMDAAVAMNRLIYDQLLEGDFNERLAPFIDEFLVYPYGVVLGPIAVPRPTWAYKGDALVQEYKIAPEFYSGSILNTYWSPDSTTTQDGTYVLVREQYTRGKLEAMMEMEEHYDVGNIKQILERLDLLSDSPAIPQEQKQKNLVAAMQQDTLRGRVVRHGPSGSTTVIPAEGIEAIPGAAHSPFIMGQVGTAWTYTNDHTARLPGNSIDAVTYYGKLTGHELKHSGYRKTSRGTEIEAVKQYEVEITLVLPFIIKMIVYESPHALLRPVHAASALRGRSLLEAYRGLEAQYNELAMFSHNNDYLRSAGLTEADMSALPAALQEEILRLSAAGKPFIPKPGMLFPRKKDRVSANDGSRAITVHYLAQAMGDIPQKLQILSNDIDRFSGVPASFHGEPVGSGANRTFRGMSMLSANASRLIKDIATVLDKQIFAPVGEAMYRYNLLYAEDASIKGDCAVVAKGAQGAVDKEVAMQQAVEKLANVAQVMGMSANITDIEMRAKVEAAVTIAVLDFLAKQGFDMSEVDAMSEEIIQRVVAEQQAQMQQAQMQQTVASAPEQVYTDGEIAPLETEQPIQ